LERLETAHLEAAHAQRVEWMKERVVTPPLGVYQDFRAILHIHAEDADHTKGTRAEVLKAAREADVQVVMFTDHRGPKPETWHGIREGVLFIPGSEDDHELRYPSPLLELRFLSHLEERPDMPAEGFQGMEIYNRHTDAKDHKEFNEYIQSAMKQSREWHHLVEKRKQFPDEVFAAATGPLPLFLARWDREIAVHPFTGIGANDAHQNQIFNGVTFDPYAVAFRHTSTHILARELTEPEIRSSLAAGHVYVAHDWLCDPAGFSYVAQNNLGVFDMGDTVPMLNNTHLEARFPIPAKIKLIRNGVVVAEATGSKLDFVAREEGAYRLEAWLAIDGEDRPWIYSNPIYVRGTAGLTLPSMEISANVEVRKDIVYTDGEPADAGKHKLDLYMPKNKKDYPVLMFIHGGNWRMGDRSMYPPLGNRFAKMGIAVVVPSYRLMPMSQHPAQIEDVAAAFAWVYKNIAQYGGDTKRIYIAGHSAGGHLVALLALDDLYLKKYDIPPGAIRGVAALSGVYDVSMLGGFKPADGRRDASPMHYVHAHAPPFLITYCQWDYPALPKQARDFAAAIKKDFVETHLEYIPGENHITEMLNIVKDDDPTAQAILKFIR